MRRLVGLLVALALTLGVGSVFAQSGALPVPVNISPVGPSPGGLSTVATFDARGLGGAANAGYYSRPVLVSNSTLGGLARGLLRRSLPVAAMVAAVEAAGWAIDELTRQVMDGPPPKTQVPPGDYYYTDGYQSLKHPSASAAASWTAQYLTGGSYRYEVVKSLTQCGTPNLAGVTSCKAELKRIRVSNPDQTAQVMVNIDVVENLTPNPVPITAPVTYPSPVPDEQLGQVVRDNPQLHNDALRNPDGSVNRNPDVVAAAQALANELASANPSPDPTAEWDTGNQGGDPQHSPANIEFPNFCEWASVVCSAIDWLREPPEPSQDVDMPEVDLPGPSGWVSSLGQGSCPAPHIINLNLGTQVYEWDPWCDLAARIKPLVIASAAFAALLILAGVSRRGDGNA